jgi:hypothetical protein
MGRTPRHRPRGDRRDRCVAAAVDELWRPIAAEQLRRRVAGEPPTHHLLALSGISRRSGRLLGPVQGLRDDGWTVSERGNQRAGSR